jgi:kynureninase
MTSVQFESTEDFARQCDTQDTLARFREEFTLRPGQIYLDGNSLGLLSVRAEKSLLRVLEDWKNLGIEGWMHGEPDWFTFAEQLGQRTAPLIGAKPEEVIVTNSTTVNLHQLLATLYMPEAPRTAILTDALAFPSDRYAIESHLRLRGRDPETDLKIVPSRDGLTLDESEIVTAMTDDIQIIVLPAVLYTSGQLLDIPGLTEEAHKRGIVVGFDCSHSIGAVPHRLSDWGVDFAFWCSYKYLNGGPGAAGGLYLNRRHFGRLPGLAGWFGSRKDTQFDMSPLMEPAEDAGRLQIGTPNILSMAPLLGSLEMIEEAGSERIRAKSLALTAYLRTLIEKELTAFGFTFATPQEDARRGGHVALVHPEAVRICRALKPVGVLPDYRPPHIVRLAPVALTTSFLDCYQAVQRLRDIMEHCRYEEYARTRELVA